MNYPESFQNLIESFKRLPGIGIKNAERLVYHILSMDYDHVQDFSNALIELIEKITHCKQCGNICEGELCEICQDSSRDNSIICIVEQPKDIYAMEKIKEFKGLYHVLQGAVSIMDGIGIEDLNILPLFDRINESTHEIIIATNPTREGETTALYLSKLLSKHNIEVTRIAHGLPIGSNIDYADEMTLLKSLEGRKKI
jgi:recombination protein RecR